MVTGSPSFSSPRQLTILALALLAVAAFGCAQGEALPPPEPRCGDGEVQGEEACDNGLKNSDTTPDACRTTCRFAACGDGTVDATETCDDGNATAGDGCSDTCQAEFECGDGVCDVGKGESCSACEQDCCVCGDMKCTSSYGETCEMCPSECCPNCGNGALDRNETCDDGNNASDDGCSADCQDEDDEPTCGNGALEEGEACDDGNLTELDGCSPECTVEFTCGNGRCEANRGETCRACVEDCCPDCGNGVLDAGEECDGAELAGETCTSACYDGGTLGCTGWCTYDVSGCTGDLPTCGDGIAECDEACDGEDLRGESCGVLGFGDGMLTCTACQFETSACGARQVFLQEDFDHGCPPAGFSLADDWECGTPVGVGPTAAYSSPSCLATQIDGTYNNNQTFATTTATTPPIDLTGAIEPMLTYRAWVHTEGTSFDGYNVKVSTDDGATFTLLTTVTPQYNLTIDGERAWGGNQSTSGWQRVTAALQAYVGSTIVLQFAFRSDASGVYPGVYIDDLLVSEPLRTPLEITTATLADAVINQPYVQALSRTGGSPAATWSIAGGSNQAWLSINPSTGELSGSPSVAELGPVSVTIRVEEPAAPINFAEKTLSFNVIDLCGNGVLDPGEACDGAALDGLTCTGACYDGGALSCSPTCTYDFSTCTGDLPTCGDGIAECNEACDTNDFRGESCQSRGFASGTLGCAGCAFDDSGCAGRQIFFVESFDEGCPPAGFALGGDWECGTPTSVGPPAAHSAPACIATQIDGNYNNSQAYATATVTTPPIDLAGADSPVLTYWAWVHTEGASFDGYNVKVSTDGGATFTLLTTATPAYNLTVGGEQAWGGDQSALGWQPVRVDLDAFAGNVIMLRFAFRSDSSVVRPGVYIDDLMVSESFRVPLEITTASLADAPINLLYAQPLSRTGGSPAATWSIVGGVNNAWLSIDPVTGRLSGTPGTADLGVSFVYVRVQEPAAPSNFSERTFSINVFDYCGNGVIDPGEECDGAALGAVTCTTACYDGGTIACTPGCTYDYSACTGDLPTCGNGVAECGEACDIDDLHGETCASLGFSPGVLACAGCEFDTTACGASLLYFEENFDDGCPGSGFTLGGDWECGTPTAVGPPAANSAPSCIATQIDANYNNNQSYATTVATTPPINLAYASEPVLSYRAWVNTEGSTYDGYNVKVSTDGGATFTLVTTVTPAYNLTIAGEQAWGGNQASLGWRPIEVDLRAFAGNSVILRFAFRSDGSVTRPGVYIDDLMVSERALIPIAIATSTVGDAAVGQAYEQRIARTGGSTGAIWTIVGGTNHAWLSIDPTTGVLTGTPDASNLGPVSVTVRSEEPIAPTNFGEATFSFNVIDAAYVTSYEGACPAGWTLSGDWECGVPTVGPSAAVTGNQCIATQIDANYTINQAFATATATSPIIDLTSTTAPQLSFRLYYHTETNLDGANLRISVDGGPFDLLTSVVPAYDGTVDGQTAWTGNRSALGWQLATADLSAYAGRLIQLRFSFRSDGSVNNPGVFIDDLRVLR